MGYDFVVGDTLSLIEVAFVQQDGTPPDISGAAVTLVYRMLLGPERVRAARNEQAMTILDPMSARVEYRLQPGDLLEGIMRCEFSIMLFDGRVATSLEFTDFLVRARL